MHVLGRLFGVALCVSLPACGSGGEDPGPAPVLNARAAALSSFASCADLDAYLTTMATDQVLAPWTAIAWIGATFRCAAP